MIYEEKQYGHLWDVLKGIECGPSLLETWLSWKSHLRSCGLEQQAVQQNRPSLAPRWPLGGGTPCWPLTVHTAAWYRKSFCLNWGILIEISVTSAKPTFQLNVYLNLYKVNDCTEIMWGWGRQKYMKVVMVYDPYASSCKIFFKTSLPTIKY
jgi:hypothetical protein